MDGWMGGWMDGWTGGWVDGQKDKDFRTYLQDYQIPKEKQRISPSPTIVCVSFPNHWFQRNQINFSTASSSSFSFLNAIHRSLGFYLLQKVFEVKMLHIHKHRCKRHHRANTFSRETSRKIITSLSKTLESSQSSGPYLKVGPFCIYSLDTNQLVEVCNPSKTTTGHRIQCPPIPHSEGVIFLQHSQSH